MKLDPKQFRRGHFQYHGKFFPLDEEKSTVSIEIHTTFRLRKTIVVQTAAKRKDVQRKTDFSSLSGFVAFDLESPLDWRNSLTGPVRTQQLTDDDDVSIYTDWHQFANRQSLQFIERDGLRFLTQMSWQLGPKQLATAFGWCSLTEVAVHVDDKVFGQRFRQYLKQYGEEIPLDLKQEYELGVRENAWSVLEEFAPTARSQFQSTKIELGMIAKFSPTPEKSIASK